MDDKTEIYSESLFLPKCLCNRIATKKIIKNEKSYFLCDKCFKLIKESDEYLIREKKSGEFGLNIQNKKVNNDGKKLFSSSSLIELGLPYRKRKENKKEIKKRERRKEISNSATKMFLEQVWNFGEKIKIDDNRVVVRYNNREIIFTTLGTPLFRKEGSRIVEYYSEIK